MKIYYNNLCTYLGSFIGFVGALFMAIALGAITEGYQPNAKCFERLYVQSVDAVNAMRQCAEYFVVMKHPILNQVGLILICIGFFIQFSPFLIIIAKRSFASLERFH